MDCILDVIDSELKSNQLASTTTLLSPTSMPVPKKQFNILHLGPCALDKTHLSVFEGLLSLGFEIKCFAELKSESLSTLNKIASDFTGQLEIYETSNFDKKALEKINVVLFTGKPEASLLKMCIAKGIVPIFPESLTPKGFENFNAQAETGNSFQYDLGSHWDLFATVVRTFENFKFSYDWSQLVKSVKKVEL